jgi:flagellin-like protein
MNVFGKNERSWRKARKRGVSPIIATILLVAITVVLAAVLYVLISGLTSGGVGSKPIGTAFTVGPNPSGGTVLCAATSTFAGTGCGPSHYEYALTIESSTITFGNILFQVKNSVGIIATATGGGGFTILNITGKVVASFATTAGSGNAMSMPSSGWSLFSATTGACGIAGVLCNSGTSLTNQYSLIVDMGTANPSGQAYSLTGLGNSGYTGTTGGESLS